MNLIEIGREEGEVEMEEVGGEDVAVGQGIRTVVDQVVGMVDKHREMAEGTLHRGNWLGTASIQPNHRRRMGTLHLRLRLADMEGMGMEVVGILMLLNPVRGMVEIIAELHLKEVMVVVSACSPRSWALALEQWVLG